MRVFLLAKNFMLSPSNYLVECFILLYRTEWRCLKTELQGYFLTDQTNIWRYYFDYNTLVFLYFVFLTRKYHLLINFGGSACMYVSNIASYFQISDISVTGDLRCKFHSEEQTLLRYMSLPTFTRLHTTTIYLPPSNRKLKWKFPVTAISSLKVLQNYHLPNRRTFIRRILLQNNLGPIQGCW